ncbi:DNA-directed RNA polymerase sigma 54 factor [Deferribacter desulfuricans SSM1]|uniref:DNA-directed RNA polymerase sigma 54 factor n=1 Tax=Deferribacter desulfuricans (strain DSM 14783 / JCM 11476 / NBRC 101012 / SSM1) TaxID=639282 RepID=D3PD41_DEFDS|nr:RNA polymerase factor sigma-54 [Deferribacter desulfuricans]BAI80514.1 DNA-directed RNA polymerase sigma 54 factor [Deferribacter desulfuricans SSM1]
MGKLDVSVNTKLSQKLLITPQMKQSLNILQLPMFELTQELNGILEENPVLEEVVNKEDILKNDTEEVDAYLKELQKVEWESFFSDDEYKYYVAEDEDINFEKFVSKKPDLYSHLLFQLNISGLKDEDYRIGEYIIGNLTENGYFRLDIDESVEYLGVTKEKFLEVLKRIQQFEPSGIAARDLKECLLIQLRDFNVSDVDIYYISELLENYEDELINNDYSKILKELEIEKSYFDYLLNLIKRVDPKPGLKFSDSTVYVIPDVYVIKTKNGLEVKLNEEHIPSIKLNSYYLKMLKNNNLDENTKEYVENKIKNALWIIKSLNQRKKAILQVVEFIVEHQKKFFMEGDNRLKPLKLKDVSEATGLHESTVSRVTSNKYLACEYGIFEIKNFFIKGFDTANGAVSVDDIKELIKDIIDKEDKRKPFSDEKIVEILAKKGIKIARRTVAKYRDELGIPATSKRKIK